MPAQLTPHHSAPSLAAQSDALDGDVPPIRARAPYAVERFPYAPGFVQLVGYDGRGQFMTSTTIPARCYTPRARERMRRWCMKNDEHPVTLSLLD